MVKRKRKMPILSAKEKARIVAQSRRMDKKGLNKAFKISVRVGNKEFVSFFRKKTSADKFIRKAKALAIKTKARDVNIRLRKPIKK